MGADVLTHLSEWVKVAIGAVAFAGALVAIVLGAYQGAKRQTSASLKPLVGDPPLEVQVPLAKRLEELLWRLERQEERTLQSEREISGIRDDVTRAEREIAACREQTRGHEERLSRLERRADNVERRCGMTHRADTDPPQQVPA